ncbi:hypothetical protein RF11_14481 [Thelohanellus kitauei]|uniref:Uncharacterized protein n=1 Tax=Thelohanellus kitauei TaxID=669202 RepID=A0A0C2JAX1_THEKT|nr:hypothetical protein RF11_14481 [Thelohanellus kitauei]
MKLNLFCAPCPQSDNSPLEKYYQLLEKAQNLQLHFGDEESIKAYLEVAKFAEANELEYRKIVLGYDEASQILYDIDESRAIECFQNSIDTYIKHGDINKAIQRCIQYGHSIKTETNETVKGDEFLAQAERLRAQHNIPHFCVITTFEKTEYYFEDYKTLKELIRKFNVEEERDGRLIITHRSFCADCIQPFYDLLEHFDELTKEYRRWL